MKLPTIHPTRFGRHLVAVSLVSSIAVGILVPIAATADDALPGIVSEDVAEQESARKRAAWTRAAEHARPATANQLDWDATYYALDLDLDHPTQTLAAVVTVVGEVLAGSIAQVELDLSTAMAVSLVQSGGVSCSFAHGAGLLTVILERPYVQGETFSLDVHYQGNPASYAFGWDWADGLPMIWTLSEPYGARNWWPCKDQPADKADSVDIRATVDNALTVASNGTLMSVTPNGAKHTYHWHESHPIVTYLVSLAIHPYVQFSDVYEYAPGLTMPLDYYVFASNYDDVQYTYSLVPDMLAVFAGHYGEYPFLDEKYGHAEFVWGGGMEHQTISSMGGHGELLIAHELAHQWFGDFITCEDFHHIWLNEGFATYSEALWLESAYGAQAMHDNMAFNAYYGPGTIYVENANDSGEIFNGNLSYNKASWVLHMLRHVVGDGAFFQILQTYYTTHAEGTATTAEFQAVAESISGLDLSAFFQQWIYGEYFPIYTYGWSTEDLGGSWELTLTIDQVQTSQVFTMPIDVEVELAGGGTEIRVVQNDAAQQAFVLTFADEPVRITLDPEHWILRQVIVPVQNATLDQGILLVNGVHWDSYGSEITDAYEAAPFAGDHEFDFWDVFQEPAGGYPAALPAPLGHGPVDPAVMGQYSSVVWIGNNYQGDLAYWLDSPNIGYLQAGGNLLLMARHGQSFLTEPLRDYLGIQWTDDGVQLSRALSVYTGLTTMTSIGTQSWCSIFDKDALGPESTLLFTDPAFNPDAGLGVWRQVSPPPATTMPTNGGFVFLSGRPYRWERTALDANTDFILGTLFGEEGPVAVHDTPSPGASVLRLGRAMPNPMQPSTTVPFVLPGRSHVRARVLDAQGRLVRILADEPFDAGAHRIAWNGFDARGRRAACGVYFFELHTGAERATTRLVLTR